MSDQPLTDAGEKAVSIAKDPKKHGVEVHTNTRLREKYFVDGSAIVSSMHSEHFKKKERFSRIIRSPKVVYTNKPVKVRYSNSPLRGDIKVDVIRNQDKVTGIKISCPCGRHTELDCEYNTQPAQQ